MNIDEGSSRKRTGTVEPLYVAPEEGQSDLRHVRKENTSERVVKPEPSNGDFIPLTERGVKVEPVKAGIMTRILSGLSSSFLSFFGSGFTSLSKSQTSETNELRQTELDNQGVMKGDVKSLTDDWRKAESELKGLRKKLGSLSNEQIERYLELVKDQLNCEENLALKKVFLSRSKEQVAAYDQELQKFQKKLDQGMRLLKENVATGLKMIGGLREVFSHKKKEKHAGTVYQLNLGDVKYSDPGRYDFTAKNLTLNIDRFEVDGEDVVLSVAEFSTDCFSLGEEQAYGPVKLAGKGTVRVRPPLSEHVQNLMACPSYKLFDHYKKLSAEFASLQETGGFEVGEVLQVSLEGLEQLEGDQRHGILTPSVGMAITKLLAPLASIWKVESGVEHLKKSRSRENAYQLKMEGCQEIIKAKSSVIERLASDIEQMPHCEAKEHCVTELHSIKTAMEGVQSRHKDREKTWKEQKQVTAAMEYRNAHAGDALTSYQNGLMMFHKLRELNQQIKAGGEATITTGFDQQKIDFTETGHAELTGATLKLSGFHCDERGLLSLNMPEVAMELGLCNEVSGEVEAFPVSLKGITLKVRPPMGAILTEILELNFPLELIKLERLWERYEECTSKYHNENGLMEPREITSYLEIDVGSASCLTEEGREMLTGSDERQDMSEMASGVSRLMDKELTAEALKGLLQTELGMKDQSAHQVLNMLCLGFLGEPEKGEVLSDETVLENHDLPDVVPDAELVVESPVPVTDSPGMDLSMEEPEPSEHKLKSSSPVISPEPISQSLSDIESISTPVPPVSIKSEEVAEVVPAIKESAPDVVSGESVKRPDEPLVHTPKVSKPPEKRPVKKVKQPVSGKVTEATLSATEIKLSDLKRCSCVTQVESVLNGDKLETRFDMKTSVLELFGKLPWYARWLVGSGEVTLVVTSDLKHEVLQLDKPNVKAKSSGWFGIGRMLTDYWLKKALGKGHLQLQSEHQANAPKLSFKRVGVEHVV